MSDVTVCLVYCGEETRDECWRRIEPHRSEFVYQEINNITPQHAALNQMIAQCQTKYLIPLDADFWIYPDTWARLMNNIKNHEYNDSWHSILHSVYDTQIKVKGRSFKVFRTEVVKRFPYKDARSADKYHYLDLKRAGYHAIDLTNQEPVADHVVAGSYFSYMRMKDMMLCRYEFHENSRDLPSGYLRKAAFIYESLYENDTDDSRFAIMGLYDGLMNDSDVSKSFAEEMPRKIEEFPEVNDQLRKILYGALL